MRIALLALLASACTLTPVLVPDTGALRAPGTKTGAFAEANGVRITINGDAWQADPVDLGDALTPVLVTIENNSRVPLRVSYQDFSLVGATGFRYAALPPFQVQGQLPVGQRELKPGIVLAAAEARPAPSPVGAPPPPRPEPAPAPLPREPRVRPPVVNAPHFHHEHFYVAPRFGPLYPGIEAWPYFYPYDQGYYDRFYDMWPETLPTQDMVNQAMPEGVIESQGRISGFVFFQKVAPREQHVRFEMKLVDAHGQREFGDLAIPLAVSEGE